MTVEVLTIGVLIAMFVVATLTPLNMGLLGFTAAFVIGVFVAGMSAKEVSGAIPADLFVTLLGITYLFAVAQGNGAIARMIGAATKAVGSRAAMIPWVMFVIAAVLTGVGALSPAAVAILAPLAMGFARRHGLNPMLSGLLIVHGAQAGGFSPLSVYGGITRDAVLKGGLTFDAYAPFFGSLVMNTAAALGLYLVLGRLSRGKTADGPEEVTAAEAEPLGGGLQTWATFAALVALAVLTLAFKLELGYVAISLGLLLSFVSLKSQRGVLARLPWSEIVLILGVATYVGVLQKMGVIDYVGEHVADVGSPAFAALLLLYIGAVVSAFASSAAVLGSLIPLAIPLLRDQPPLAVVTFVAAMAVASTIVDVSPFSTNGALVLASAEEADRQKLFKRLMGYGALVTLLAPPILWLAYLAVSSR
jgi:di/tricarboxylate transporter